MLLLYINTPVVHHEFFSKGVGNCFLAIIADIVEANTKKRKHTTSLNAENIHRNSSNNMTDLRMQFIL